MTVFNVLGSLKIGEDTAIIVDGPGEYFKNGTGVLDETGKPYEVLSVGLDAFPLSEDKFNKTSLLLGGTFSSRKLFV